MTIWGQHSAPSLRSLRRLPGWPRRTRNLMREENDHLRGKFLMADSWKSTQIPARFQGILFSLHTAVRVRPVSHAVSRKRERQDRTASPMTMARPGASAAAAGTANAAKI